MHLFLLLQLFTSFSFAEPSETDLMQKLHLLEQGLKWIQTKNYPEAISALSQAVKIEDEAPAELLLGTSYFYTNQLKLAQTALTRVLKLHPDTDTRETAEYFLEQIKETIQQGNWSAKNPGWLYLDLSYGDNSNTYTVGNSLTPTSTLNLNLQLSGGYVFRQGEPFFIRTHYQGSWNETLSDPTNRTITQTFASNFTYQKNQFILQFTPLLEYETYGAEQQGYLINPGAAFRIEKKWSALGLGASYQFIKDGALNPEYAYLSGNTQSEKLYFTYAGNTTITTVSLLAIQNQTGDENFSNGGLLPLAYTALGASVDLFWFFNTHWDFTLSPSFISKSFSTQPIPNLGYQRSDDTYSIQAKLSYWLNPEWRVYFSEGATLNTSSLGANDVEDLNYFQNLAFIGITYNIVH